MPYFENTTRDMALPFMIILNLLTIFMQVFPKCHAADEYFFLTSFMITIRRFRFISHHTFFFPATNTEHVRTYDFYFLNKNRIYVWYFEKNVVLVKKWNSLAIVGCPELFSLVVSGDLLEQAWGRHSLLVPRDQLTLSAAEPDNKGQKFESKFWPIISRCLLVQLRRFWRFTTRIVDGFRQYSSE